MGRRTNLGHNVADQREMLRRGQTNWRFRAFYIRTRADNFVPSKFLARDLRLMATQSTHDSRHFGLGGSNVDKDIWLSPDLAKR
jgi:hypothetical protein